MRLFIEPADVWLFRDGRPFDAGSDHHAASLFPPPPSVIQGAIRAAQIVRHTTMDEYVNENAPEQSPPFALRGPFIARRDNGVVTRYLPIPADASRVGNEFRARSLQAASAAQTNLPDGVRSLLWQVADPPKGEKYIWAEESAIRAYLQAGTPIPAADAIQESDLFEREGRLGVELDYEARRYQQGALYQAEFIRAQAGVGLEVQVSGLDWNEPGLLKLGGESHMARYVILPAEQTEEFTFPTKFRLYLATPTWFSGGWRPSGEKDPNEGWSKLFGGKVELVAAALRGYEVRGGFDLFTNAHKPARRLVPAGSVYYFEAHESIKPLSNLTESVADTQLGLGQIILGRWSDV